ncbi:MAG: hypothetical protein U1E78_05930 [Gammaproteobacteria bacterium]
MLASKLRTLGIFLSGYATHQVSDYVVDQGKSYFVNTTLKCFGMGTSIEDIERQMPNIYPQQMIFRVGAERSRHRSVHKVHDCGENREGNNPENSGVKGIPPVSGREKCHRKP